MSKRTPTRTPKAPAAARQATSVPQKPPRIGGKRLIASSMLLPDDRAGWQDARPTIDVWLAASVTARETNAATASSGPEAGTGPGTSES